MQTRAAIPYSDRTLSATSKTILANRQELQRLSTLESTSAWKKRSPSSWVN